MRILRGGIAVLAAIAFTFAHPTTASAHGNGGNGGEGGAGGHSENSGAGGAGGNADGGRGGAGGDVNGCNGGGVVGESCDSGSAGAGGSAGNTTGGRGGASGPTGNGGKGGPGGNGGAGGDTTVHMGTVAGGASPLFGGPAGGEEFTERDRQLMARDFELARRLARESAERRDEAGALERHVGEGPRLGTSRALNEPHNRRSPEDPF
jgi:hypothetical protein